MCSACNGVCFRRGGEAETSAASIMEPSRKFGGVYLQNPKKPHLSLCLRVLSRRRARACQTRQVPLSRCVKITMVLLPESFRGGCSFGAGLSADLSRRDCLN